MKLLEREISCDMPPNLIPVRRSNDELCVNAFATRSRRSVHIFALTADLALDEAIGARLGSVHLGVLAGVLEALVPGEVYPMS